MQEIILDITEFEEGAIFKLGSELTGGSGAMEFQNSISDKVADGLKKIILDLAEVDIINSSGLGMIVSAHTTLKQKEVEVILTNLPQKVQDLVSMTHLDKVLKIAENIESAKS
jgi:anti-sigma B factor antagonist